MSATAGSPATRAITVGLVAVALVALASLLGPLLPGGAPREAEDGVVDPARFVPPGELVMQRAYEWTEPDAGPTSEAEAGACQSPIWARVYFDETCGAGSFEIVDGSRRVHAETGHRFVVLHRVPMLGDHIEFFPENRSLEALDAAGDPASAAPGSVSRLEAPDTDVTGDGVPEVLVAEWTGGAHCCFNLFVIQLWPMVRVQRIEAQHSETGLFLQADDDAPLELRMPDWTFAYWKTNFAQSPAPDMVLKFDGRMWQPSAARMHGAPAGPDALREMAEAWRGWSPDESGEWHGEGIAPWVGMLERIYAGHAEQAWQVLDAAWPGDEQGKRAFRAELMEALRGSPAWPALVQMNGSKLDA